MKVLLDVNGWQKIIDIDYQIHTTGELTIPIEPPLSFMVNSRVSTKIQLFHKGDLAGHTPIYYYKHP